MCTSERLDLLFVAVELVDGRFELDGLDHLPRAQRIQVGAAVGRVSSERESTGSGSRNTPALIFSGATELQEAKTKKPSPEPKAHQCCSHLTDGLCYFVVFFSSSLENWCSVYFHYAPFVPPI